MDKSGEEEAVEVFENKDEYMSHVVNWFEEVKLFKLKIKADSIRYLRKYKGIDHVLFIMYSNNTYELKSIHVSETGIDLQQVVAFENLGHQAVVRSIAFSRDDSMLVSTSADIVKVWSSLIGFQVFKTIQIKDIICCTFLPLKRYVCLGSRAGNIYLINVDSGEIDFEAEKAHDDTIWNIDCSICDDELTVSTASSDGYIKFWAVTEKMKSKKICLEVLRTVPIGEPIQWLKFSNSAKHYAVALMDNSIQVASGQADPLLRLGQAVRESVRPQDASPVHRLLFGRHAAGERVER